MSRSPNARHIPCGDNELCVWEWPGESPPCVFTHATGFHGRCWDAVIAELPGVHCLAIDLRGHGQSTKQGPFGWSDFGSDLEGVLRALDVSNAVGVGHSLGGHVTAQVALRRPESFRSLLLLDPVILPPEVYMEMPAEFTPEQAHFTARRRRFFESPEAMIERFESREPYASWRPDVLRAYCEFGLVRQTEGSGYTLACPPEVEAEIYGSSPFFKIHDQLSEIRVPVHIVRARRKDVRDSRQDFSSSPTWPELVSVFPDAWDTYVPELSHFIPMQDPVRTAGWVREMLERDAAEDRIA